MSSVRYTFCDDDLLSKAQNYSLSSFLGPDFLTIYLQFREKIKNGFLKKTVFLTDMDLITKLSLEQYAEYDPTKLLEYESASVLRWILFNFLKPANDSTAEHFAASFVKKFEIKKKIYSTYSKEFKELSDDFTNLQNYLLLSVICMIKYRKTSNLKFLNAALKINDVLCSQKNLIKDSDSGLFVYSLEKETSCIRQLCDRMKIVLTK